MKKLYKKLYHFLKIRLTCYFQAKRSCHHVIYLQINVKFDYIQNLGKTVAAEKAVDQLYIEQLESQLDDKTKEIDNFQVENELLAAKASDCQKNLEETTVIDENSKIEELNSDNIEDQTVEKPESAQKIDPDNQTCFIVRVHLFF